MARSPETSRDKLSQLSLLSREDKDPLGTGTSGWCLYGIMQKWTTRLLDSLYSRQTPSRDREAHRAFMHRWQNAWWLLKIVHIACMLPDDLFLVTTKLWAPPQVDTP